MKETRAEGRCIPCKDSKTRDWYAWLDRMPPPPDELHIIGEVYVPNPGVEPLLVPKEPQGVNPEMLLMDLYLCQRPGVWPRVFVWKGARYDKVKSRLYTQVNVFCEDTIIADVPVDVVE